MIFTVYSFISMIGRKHRPYIYVEPSIKSTEETPKRFRLHLNNSPTNRLGMSDTKIDFDDIQTAFDLGARLTASYNNIFIEDTYEYSISHRITEIVSTNHEGKTRPRQYCFLIYKDYYIKFDEKIANLSFEWIEWM